MADNRPMELSEDAVEMLLALGDAIKAQSDATGGQLQKLDGKMDSLKVCRPWIPCIASHLDTSHNVWSILTIMYGRMTSFKLLFRFPPGWP